MSEFYESHRSPSSSPSSEPPMSPMQDTQPFPLQNEDLYPIAVLVDELKHEDVSIRLNAIHNLTVIALAMGAEQTRNELIPFLSECLEDEEEVLLALAGELGALRDYLGHGNYLYILVPPLESLAMMEESTLRDKAVESLCLIIEKMSKEMCETYAIPLTKRLSLGDWFTSRTSACGLYAALYPKLSAELQEELRNFYTQLAKDDTPMVRRAAAQTLAKFAKVMAKKDMIVDLLPLFWALAHDDQDSVRLLMVEHSSSMALLLTEQEIEEWILPIIRSFVGDKSWRVRFMVAEQFVDLAHAILPVVSQEELIVAYVNMVRDSEPEVRSVIAGHLTEFSKILDRESIFQHILVPVQELVADVSQFVRASIANQINGLAPILGKEWTIKHLLPLLLHLLKDEYSDVRLNVISKLEQVNDVIGVDLLSQSLLPAIMDLAEDKQWRVRSAVIEHIPMISKQLGVKFFNEKLADLCISWLVDPVFSIRNASAQNLKRLAIVFGAEWTQNIILPKVLFMSSHPKYLYRITFLLTLCEISEAISLKALLDPILPTILRLSQDPIPNVRFNVAKALEKLLQIFLSHSSTDVSVYVTIRDCLLTLSHDNDTDVQFYAHGALVHPILTS
jgi:serine/threonine-protein phosphatase 2A regulatory subunit A